MPVVVKKDDPVSATEVSTVPITGIPFGEEHRHKPLFRAQAVNQPLLPFAKYGVGKNRKMTKHPKQIHSLHKGWDDVAGTDGSLHPHNALH